MLPQTRPQPAPLDLAQAAWLDACFARSESESTRRAYAATLSAFRAMLQRVSLDLDSEPRLIALVAQQFASRRHPAAATHNARLACLSSFYAYAVRLDLLPSNPISHAARRPLQAYASARSLEADQVRTQLASIDRTTLAGCRDVALLAIALTTGRRAAELAGLHRGDVQIAGDVVTLTWRRTKGGGRASDILDRAVGLALIAYLHRLHGPQWRALPASAAVWRATRQRSTQPLSTRAIARICLRRLGTERVHALRHTFARELEAAGAPVSAIQARLGHASLATTGRYLAALRSAENPWAAALARRFGLTE
jgi:site-specific recombinase XerD